MSRRRFKQSVVIQKKSVAADGQRGQVTTWVTRRRVWAQVAWVAPKLNLLDQNLKPGVTAVVTFPYRDDVTSEDRMLLGTRVLQFKGPPVDTENRRRMMKVLCEVVDGGV